MIDLLLKPVSPEINKLRESMTRYQLGKHLDIHDFDEGLPDLKQVDLALVGLDETADRIRPHFYALSHDFRRFNIADLGNLRDNDAKAIRPLIKELLAEQIIPVFVGKNPSYTLEHYNGYDTFSKYNNLVIVDKRIPFANTKEAEETLYLDAILNNPNTNLMHLSIIGYHMHYTSNFIQHAFQQHYFDLLRLGTLRTNLEWSEPVIRDADLMSFNLSALKKSEMPACADASPSGLITEEACQITYYAGLSDKLTSLGIYGFDPDLDIQNQSAELVAQMIWYFIFGVSNRKRDYPVSMGNFVNYIVDFKKSDFQITFWKSTQSDRWWMEVPTTNKEQNRHKLVPCSYEDYLQACREELPERLLNAFNRFS